MDLALQFRAGQSTQTGSWRWCWGGDDTEGESRPLTNNLAVAAPSQSYMRIALGFFSHPIVMPLAMFLETFVVGYGAASRQLPGYLDCFDDPCSAARLGPPLLHNILIGGGTVFFVGNFAVGTIGALERRNLFNIAKSENELALRNLVEVYDQYGNTLPFSHEGGSVVDEDEVEHVPTLSINGRDISLVPDDTVETNAEKPCCGPINPLAVHFMSSVVTPIAGFGSGVIFLLLIAASLLGGSGFDLEALAATAIFLKIALAALGAGTLSFGGFLVWNHISTNKMIAETNTYKSDTEAFNSTVDSLVEPERITPEWLAQRDELLKSTNKNGSSTGSSTSKSTD